MCEAQRIECVRDGQASLKEMVEGLLDGPESLRAACQIFLMQSDVCLQRATPLPLASTEPEPTVINEPSAALLEAARKRRSGLPEGYVPRVYRH